MNSVCVCVCVVNNFYINLLAVVYVACVDSQVITGLRLHIYCSNETFLLTWNTVDLFGLI